MVVNPINHMNTLISVILVVAVVLMTNLILEARTTFSKNSSAPATYLTFLVNIPLDIFSKSQKNFNFFLYWLLSIEDHPMFNPSRRHADKNSSSSGNKRHRANGNMHEINPMQSIFGFPNFGNMGMGSG